MPTTPSGHPASKHSRILSTMAHDMGNLASRLIFLTANLKRELTAFRQLDESSNESSNETTELLEDTHRQLQRMAVCLREVAKDV